MTLHHVLSSVILQALFTEDEDGHTGPFLSKLSAQEDEECDMYLNDISNQLEGMEEVKKLSRPIVLKKVTCA